MSMTKQEIYNKVRTHLLTQNAQAVTVGKNGETCAYRGDDGLTCAVGCLIPDEQYRTTFEGMGVTSQHVQKALVDAGVLNTVLFDDDAYKDDSTLGMLRGLQVIHDNNSPNEWRWLLDNLADRYGLQVGEF